MLVNGETREGTGPSPTEPGTQGHMTTSAAMPTTLIDLFTERLAAVGGDAHRVPESSAAAAAIRAIAGTLPDRTVWVSRELIKRAPGLIAHLNDIGLPTRVPANAAEVRDQPLGLAIAEGAIAETGSVILSEPRVPDRAVTLITETLVVVCATAGLLPSLDEAVPVLRTISNGGASYATFVTGPSRTADIERQLTVGVQGPGKFQVILVDDLG